MPQVKEIKTPPMYIIVLFDGLFQYFPLCFFVKMPIVLHQILQAGVEYKVLLDFDANESIVQTGVGLIN